MPSKDQISTSSEHGSELDNETDSSHDNRPHQELLEICTINETTYADGTHQGKETTTRVPEDPQRESLPNHGLYYAVNDESPWYINLSVGFQHFLSMFVITASVPFILTPAMCMEDTDPARSQLVSTIVFVSGIVTLLQSTIGVRLPIIQGATFSLLVPTFAILSLPEWKCPEKEVIANMSYEDKTELWQSRMREVQGAITVASLFEICIGGFGVVGFLVRYVTPLTIAPTLTMIGLALFQATGTMIGQHWGVSGASIVLAVLFSQYLRNVQVPFPSVQCKSSCKPKFTIKRFNLFQILPLLLTIIIMWTLCAILTVWDTLADNSAARTDTKTEIITRSPWFTIPYPGQWGTPTVSAAAVIGIISGLLASIVESIGDYYNNARIVGARPPPIHAVNRGIAMEGVGSLLSGLFGSGNGTTSYSGNTALMGIIKVGSRRVVQTAGLLMLFFGLFSKMSAVFITIPEPIIGGIFCVLFAMINGVGLSNLRFVDLNSSRNLFVIGFSIFFSLVVSQWMNANPDIIQTGSSVVDQLLTILLRTTMFVAGFCGFILDNTIPGTPEERGLSKWGNVGNPSDANHVIMKDTVETCNETDITYDLPWITPWLKRQGWASYLPFLPTHRQRKWKILKVDSCKR